MRKTLVEIMLLAVGFSLGQVTNSQLWQWIAYIAVGVCVVGLAVVWLRDWQQSKRRRINEIANRAGMWERSEVNRRYADLLREFWQSRAGRWVRSIPILADDSVRITSIADKPPAVAGYGILTIQLDSQHVAHVQLVAWPSTWRYRLRKGAVWMANRPWWAEWRLTELVLHWIYRKLAESEGVKVNFRKRKG